MAPAGASAGAASAVLPAGRRWRSAGGAPTARSRPCPRRTRSATRGRRCPGPAGTLVEIGDVAGVDQVQLIERVGGGLGRIGRGHSAQGYGARWGFARPGSTGQPLSGSRRSTMPRARITTPIAMTADRQHPFGQRQPPPADADHALEEEEADDEDAEPAEQRPRPVADLGRVAGAHAPQHHPEPAGRGPTSAQA